MHSTCTRYKVLGSNFSLLCTSWYEVYTYLVRGTIQKRQKRPTVGALFVITPYFSPLCIFLADEISVSRTESERTRPVWNQGGGTLLCTVMEGLPWYYAHFRLCFIQFKVMFCGYDISLSDFTDISTADLALNKSCFRQFSCQIWHKNQNGRRSSCTQNRSCLSRA